MHYTKEGDKYYENNQTEVDKDLKIEQIDAQIANLQQLIANLQSDKKTLEEL